VHSISKTPVARSVAEQIAVDAFGPGTTLTSFIELTDGWFNAVYELGLDDGRRYVLKVAPPPEVAVLTYERDIIHTEVAALALVGEHPSVPAPHVVWFDQSCRRIPSPFFVMEHLPGTSLEMLRGQLTPEQRDSIDLQLAAILREMNSMTSTWFGYPASSAPHFDTWTGAFTHMVDDVLADGEAAGVTLPLAVDDLRSIARQRSAALDEVTEARFVHWDLWDANVFVEPSTLQVTGVIDFERTFWGDPLMEAQFRAKADDARFIEAYGTAVLDLPGARTRRQLYDMYLFLIMVIEATYRRYPTNELEQSARAQLATTLAALLDR
jgi:aminoglycoside phosphotransferase (APT) family kinase protein